MDIKNAEQELEKVDSFLTKLKNVLKKHWGIILTILLCAGIYYIWKMPDPVETTIPTEEVVGTDEEYIDSEDFYETGDTIWYDDGTYDIQE